MADDIKLYQMTGQPNISIQDSSNLNARLARIENVIPYKTGGGQVASTQYSPLISNGLNNGKLDITKTSAISFRGSMSPAVVDGQFACTTTTTTITWFWDGTNSSRVIVLRHADGTSITVPGSSITITGLTASHTYLYYPFWPSNGSYNVAWAGPGTDGTPTIAFDQATATATQLAQAASFQLRSGFEALSSGGMTFAQPASGSGGGTGGGGGSSGRCVMAGTEIRPLGGYEYETEKSLQEEWVHIETSNRILHCTPDHPLYDSERGRADASWFIGKPRWVITENGEEKIIKAMHFSLNAVKVQVKMREGHLFMANGFLSHNIKVPTV